MRSRTPRVPFAAWLLWLSMGPALAAPLAMKLSPELAQVKAQPVRGRTPDVWQGALEFAEWRATTPSTLDPHHWSWDRPSGGSQANEDLRVDVSKIGFGFDLDSPAATTPSQCLAQGRFAVHTKTHGRVEDETSITLPGYPRIDCKLNGSNGGWLTLRPDFLTQRDSGTLEFGDRRWDVQSINNLSSQRSSFPLARFGYEFRLGGHVVAAVETAGPGRVWLSPALADNEKEEVAAAMSALLYYATILEELDR